MMTRPIAKKYCEGKVKRTLKRGSKALEIVIRKTYTAGAGVGGFRLGFVRDSSSVPKGCFERLLCEVRFRAPQHRINTYWGE
jgi:hypothetical protein